MIINCAASTTNSVHRSSTASSLVSSVHLALSASSFNFSRSRDGEPAMERESSTREQQPWSYSCGFMATSAWPPRSYPCSFCKREFRSAQALGGHMNVHRRERAKLRHGSPPPPLLRPAATPPPCVPNLNYPPPQQHRHRPDGSKKRSWPTDDVSLGLGLGLLSSAAGPEDDDDGLDLELRLGVSSS